VTRTTTGEVLSHKKYGEHYHSLTIVAPYIGDLVAPGQFVNVACGADRSFILRRPFSVYRVHKRGGWSPTIEIVFDVRGAGTKYLSELRSHAIVNLVGPLGRGFELPGERAHCLLVGGGVGATPLFFLADELRNEGHRVDVVLGARSVHYLLNAIDVRRLASVYRITTEDGSMGEQGRVTDVLDQMIERCESDIVYACGPHGMLAAVTRLCSERGVPTQVAVEELMACGYGVCMTCVIPVRSVALAPGRAAGPGGRGGEGAGRAGGRDEVVYARSCSEGPVFDGAAVLWEGAGAALSPEQAEPTPTGSAVRWAAPEDGDEDAFPGN
jgi:dihydroorotate dehydrogenase electron transfer subunit